MLKKEKHWVPTSLEMMMAQIAVLKDPVIKKCDAIFIHVEPRSDKLDKALFNTVLNRYKDKADNFIVLNALSKKMCRTHNISYLGYEICESFFLKKGVEKDRIKLIPPSFHTASETENFLTLAKTEKWKRLIIVANPHHQLRCFLQAVAIMKKLNYWPKLYNLTHNGIPWKYHMQKKILHNTEADITGSLAVHIKHELERIKKYSKKPPHDKMGKEKYSQHATIPEMLVYLEKRG